MIQFRNVSFSYSRDKDLSAKVLNNLSLDIREGEYVCMMGRNGCGKSTLARCMNGLLQPNEGTITIDDLLTSDISNHNALRKKVGLVFQNPENQLVSTTVEREVAFGLENMGVSSKTMQHVVPAVLERFHLSQYQYHPPHLLSGGEKQRLALAAVLAMNPKYLVLDEPTSMLDSLSRQELLAILREIKESNNERRTSEQITIVFITQFPEEALEADRLIIIHEGSVMFDDAPDVVFQNVEKLREIGLSAPIEFEIALVMARTGKPIELIRDF